MGRPLMLAGKKFGRVRVLHRAKKSPQDGFVYWRCVCDCGRTFSVRGHNLKSGNTRSCGCYHKENLSKRNTVHGLARRGHKHPLYVMWCSMWKRCTNPNTKKYNRYGGRGIRVCKRWRLFSNFITDMGKRPRGASLDRINNDGNYTPANCRWATWKQQANNRKRRK